LQILSVFDPAFRSYGRVLELAPDALIRAMLQIPLPDSGTAYRPSIPELEACPEMDWLRDSFYGGMPTQLGMCWGHNTKLNCLEYHRDSEVNLGTHDFILLLAREEKIADGVLDTGLVRAFRVPAGVAVEVYATTLHYAPCHVSEADGFRVAVALPKDTNTDIPRSSDAAGEQRLLWARNKWLLAHPASAEAAQGAYIGLKGENIDLI